MNIRPVLLALTAIAGLCGLAGITLAAQDRNTLTIPEGLGFAEFKGYETWQDVSVSATEGSLKAILANPIMIKAYRDGIPGNGQAFPEGSRIVKIEWLKAKNAQSPYFVETPTTLKSVSFIVKDTKRFPTTHGWAYAQFSYDPATETFKPSAPLSVKGHDCGYACHSAVAAKDYIFTGYPAR